MNIFFAACLAPGAGGTDRAWILFAGLEAQSTRGPTHGRADSLLSGGLSAASQPSSQSPPTLSSLTPSQPTFSLAPVEGRTDGRSQLWLSVPTPNPLPSLHPSTRPHPEPVGVGARGCGFTSCLPSRHKKCHPSAARLCKLQPPVLLHPARERLFANHPWELLYSIQILSISNRSSPHG